ncbi:cytochrome P450 [Colletotrichum eremochloae]|nr:cytochrome P450 [Colletotrichum eremochloae]
MDSTMFERLSQQWKTIALAMLLSYIISPIFTSARHKPTIPLVNPPKPFEPTSLRVKLAFALNARKWLSKGVQTGKPFRLLTDIGELTVLPSKYVRELRANPSLSFAAVINQTFHAHLPGFEGFREGTPDAHRSRDVVKRHLTNCPEWHEINLREHVLHIIARLSSRIFLGDEGARNKAWLKITMDYTTNAYIAATLLRMWPKALRPLVHWILPQCRKLRKQVAEARQIVIGIIDRRRKAKAAAEAENRPEPVFNDVIEWFAQDEQEKGSSYDPVVGQLILSQAAIHTTTDLLTQVMLDIALNPDVVGALRDEVKQVIANHGWTRVALAEMRLVDSAIKESQRLKPIAQTSMHRFVLDDVELSDGTVIRKDSVIGVPVHEMWDSAVHDYPETWDAYRFYRMSRAGSKDAALTSSTPNHLAWGYGKHACAGRFFVAQEVKVALAHMLLHYEWKIAPSSKGTKPLEIGLTLAANPMAKVLVRKVL